MKIAHGLKKQIAKMAGISPQYLTDICKGRRRATAKLARKLVDAAAHYGIESNVFTWAFPEEGER